jgi:membrane protein YqaA with SNARE-associated domain
MEAYSFLFADSFMGALVVPMHEELVFGTMNSFGGYNMVFAVVLASLGSMLGFLVNYGLGRLVLLCEKHEMLPKHSPHLDDAANAFRKHGIWLLPFTCIPIFGTAATIAAGLSRTRLAVFLPLVLLGRVGVYSYLTGGF